MNFFSLAFLMTSMFFLFSCSQNGPTKIITGKDACDYCKMTITDEKYAAELLTEKGRVYKFDDIRCLSGYKTSNPEKEAQSTSYLVDYSSGEFIAETSATLITGGSIKSPMGGNTQAYKDATKAQKAAEELGAQIQP